MCPFKAETPTSPLQHDMPILPDGCYDITRPCPNVFHHDQVTSSKGLNPLKKSLDCDETCQGGAHLGLGDRKFSITYLILCSPKDGAPLCSGSGLFFSQWALH